MLGSPGGFSGGNDLGLARGGRFSLPSPCSRQGLGDNTVKCQPLLGIEWIDSPRTDALPRHACPNQQLLE